MAIVWASGEAARGRLRVCGDQPERVAILIAGAIHLLLDVDYGRAVWGEAWVLD
jgi:hypothetical protein